MSKQEASTKKSHTTVHLKPTIKEKAIAVAKDTGLKNLSRYLNQLATEDLKKRGLLL
jgi:hypothetical protein